MNINISIVDDHPMIINGLRNMLQGYKHITLAGTYADGRELMTGLQQSQPDVLLLDIQLPDKTGDELAPMILKMYPEIKILALTNFDSVLYINTMQRHGVLGYLLKTVKQDILIEAIETVYRGNEFLEPVLREKIEHATQKTKREIYSKLSLTLREKEILQLLINGASNQDIVEKLFISFNTVRNYRARIFSKLDVNTIGELVKKTLELGLAT